MKHTVKKAISIMMVLILLLGAFAGCGNAMYSDSETTPIANVGADPESDPDPDSDSELDNEEKAKLEEDWFKLKGEPLEWWDFENGQYEGARYYGTFNGYIIFFVEHPSIGATIDADRGVGDFIFYHSGNFQIYAYKSGEFYTLEEAYRNGLLSDNQIEKIYNIHWHKYQKQVVPDYYENRERLNNIEIPSS